MNGLSCCSINLRLTSILARSNKWKMHLMYRAVYAEALNTRKQSIPRIKTL